MIGISCARGLHIRVYQEINLLIKQCFPDSFFPNGFNKREWKERIGEQLISDLHFSAGKHVTAAIGEKLQYDPDSFNSDYLYNQSDSLRALLYYRIISEFEKLLQTNDIQMSQREQEMHVCRLDKQLTEHSALGTVFVDRRAHIESPIALIGNQITIVGNVMIKRNCIILSDVMIGWGEQRDQTLIGENVVIQQHSKVFAGITIGDNAYISEKSCVYMNIPGNMIVKCMVNMQNSCGIETEIAGCTCWDKEQCLYAIWGIGLDKIIKVLVNGREINFEILGKNQIVCSINSKIDVYPTCYMEIKTAQGDIFIQDASHLFLRTVKGEPA